MNRKILITGSSGFVGKNLYKKLNKYDYVIGVSNSPSIYTDEVVDITNREELNNFLDEKMPEVVIHCAYYPNVEGCETDPEKASKINILGTNNVIAWCKKNNKKLIFFSTDYVYSNNGNKINKETDPLGALNVYTQNKIDNENEIRASLQNFIIFRTGFIYGYDSGGKNFLMQLLDSEGNMKVPYDQIINPTYIGFLCSLIEKAIDLNLIGIFNANGKEQISRLDFARKIKETLDLRKAPEGISTDEGGYKAERPLFCKVDSSLIYEKTSIYPESIDTCLEHIKQQIDTEKKSSNNLFYKREDCRSCRKRNLIKAISLGEVPIANSFLKDKADLRKIPLDIYFCPDCSLLQIINVVPAEDLFVDYRYASSTSNKIVSHFRDLAEEIKSGFNLQEKDIVFEVGSNDGVLLRELKKLGIRAIGIDPSINIVKIARENGLDTINDFFNRESVREFIKEFGKAKIVTASNVFAHIDDMDEIIKSVYEILEDDGTLIVEVHYVVSQIENFQFDNFYHEHLCEWSVPAFKNLLNRFDMELYNVQKSPIHGGSIRLFAKKKQNPEKIRESVNEIIKYEKERGFDKLELYLNFAKKIDSIKKELISRLSKLKEEGKKIAGYGASARGTILLNVCGIDGRYIDYVVDNSIEKQGRYIPGVNLKIVPASYLKENPPDKILIIAYTYAKEIMQDESWFIEQGGEFILPNTDIFDS